jgi:hypothetical protein
VVDRDGGLERGPGYVLAKAGRKQLAEGDASHDDQHQCVVAAAVCRMRPPRPTPMTAMRLTARAPKTTAWRTPG